MHEDERGRLVDGYVDAHKYVFGKRAVVYGEQDLVVGLASLLAEIGVSPPCAPRGPARAGCAISLPRSRPIWPATSSCWRTSISPRSKTQCRRPAPDLVIGSSKGYALARRLSVPLVRVGFPIHDRIDGPRLLHLGYRGAQQLFDRIANALVEAHKTPRRSGTATCRRREGQSCRWTFRDIRASTTPRGTLSPASIFPSRRSATSSATSANGFTIAPTRAGRA